MENGPFFSQLLWFLIFIATITHTDGGKSRCSRLFGCCFGKCARPSRRKRRTSSSGSGSGSSNDANNVAIDTAQLAAQFRHPHQDVSRLLEEIDESTSRLELYNQMQKMQESIHQSQVSSLQQQIKDYSEESGQRLQTQGDIIDQQHIEILMLKQNHASIASGTSSISDPTVNVLTNNANVSSGDSGPGPPDPDPGGTVIGKESGSTSTGTVPSVNGKNSKKSTLSGSFPLRSREYLKAQIGRFKAPSSDTLIPPNSNGNSNGKSFEPSPSFKTAHSQHDELESTVRHDALGNDPLHPPPEPLSSFDPNKLYDSNSLPGITDTAVSAYGLRCNAIVNLIPLTHLHEALWTQYRIPKDRAMHFLVTLCSQRMHELYDLSVSQALTAKTRQNKKSRPSIPSKVQSQTPKSMESSLNSNPSNPNPSNPNTPSGSLQIRNLMVLNLENTMTNSDIAMSDIAASTSMSQYNLYDFAFGQRSVSEYDTVSDREREMLTVYRQGLMQLIYDALSSRSHSSSSSPATATGMGSGTGSVGSPSINTFDFMMYSDGTLHEAIYHAVAMEMYYNWCYIQMVAKDLTFETHQHLMFHFKYILLSDPMKHSKSIHEIRHNIGSDAIDSYSRIIIADSTMNWDRIVPSSTTAKIFPIKAAPFKMSTAELSTINYGSLYRVRCADAFITLLHRFVQSIESGSELILRQRDEGSEIHWIKLDGRGMEIVHVARNPLKSNSRRLSLGGRHGASSDSLHSLSTPKTSSNSAMTPRVNRQ